jgi:hypothetical protein
VISGIDAKDFFWNASSGNFTKSATISQSP